MARPLSMTKEIVNWATSMEGEILWGTLPDPDPVLLKTGLSTTVFEELLSDAHVFACYQSRKSAVLTNEFKLEFPDGTSKMTKFFDKMMSDLPIEDIISQFLDAPFYGISVNEIMWEPVDGKWYPKSVQQKPNEWFGYDTSQNLRFFSKTDQERGVLLPNRKFVVLRNFPTYRNPYGVRILSRCFWPVQFKRGGFKYWATFMEKFGVPWIIGKVPRATTEESRTVLLDQLATMVQNAVAVVNDDQSIEMLNVSYRSESQNVFHDMISSANSEISKAIMTQTLTTEVGDKGAYAASQSHLSVRTDISSMDMRIVQSGFNQLIKWCCDFNFASAPVIPYFKFVQDDEPKEATSRRDSQLYSQGVRFDESYYIRTYNLRPNEFEVQAVDQQVGSTYTEQGREDQRKEQRLKDRQEPDRGAKEDDQ